MPSASAGGPELRLTPSWLYNLGAYGLYTAFGGAGLVLVKALLVVGMALLLLRLSGTGRGGWLPAVCTVLALLTMSTRLLLQPATVSLVFLTVAVGLAYRPRGAGRAPLGLPPWPLLLLFIVWANVDSRFVLGLGCMALIGLGQGLDSIRRKTDICDPGPSQGGAPSSGVRLLAGLPVLAAVCLLNPAHYQAFAWPPELRGLALPWSAANQITSPFQSVYLAKLGGSPASLAYYPLLGLGLLSFLLKGPQGRWARFLPWAALALLSAVQARAIPFFAVVAGPVLAWNLQEFFARHYDSERWQNRLWVVGFATVRGLAVVIGLAFLVCAWPGWLQGPPYEPRRWAVEPSPALAHAAAAVRRWHQEGIVSPESRGLHLSSESSSTFAWFCPEDRPLRDDRLAAVLRGGAEASVDWLARMEAAGVTHVIAHDPNPAGLFTVLERLFTDADHWPLLFLEGDVAIFGWRPPSPGPAGRGPDAGPFAGRELDLNRMGLRPSPSARAPASHADELPSWWEAFRKPATAWPVDRDEAQVHLLHAELVRRDSPYRHLLTWEHDQVAGLIGSPSGGSGPGALVDGALRLVLFRPQVPRRGERPEALPGPDQMALRLQQQFARQQDDTAPALLYLALRAARRAVDANPRDAQAYLALGECYRRLIRETRERFWGERLPELAQLRQAQASWALNKAVLLQPDLVPAHLALANLYAEQGYLDLALQHRQAALERLGKVGAAKEAGPSLLRAQEAQLREEVERLAGDVADRRAAFAEEASGMRVADRAVRALQKGLGGQARDLLLESDLSAFGAQGMSLELELLLRTGRARDVRDWISPEQKKALGAASYHWLRAQAAAAMGDYVAADEECAELARSLTGDHPDTGRPVREAAALAIGLTTLDEAPGAGGLEAVVRKVLHRGDVSNQIAATAQGLRQAADVGALRGLLALEVGEPDEAAAAFRRSLALWGDDRAAASGAGLDFAGRPLAQRGLAGLE